MTAQKKSEHTTFHRLGEILDGDINELLENIIAADQTARLAKMNEE